MKKPNLFERSIAFFSPSMALKREQDRQRLKRSYNSAIAPTGIKPILRSNKSANQELKGNLSIAAENANELYRNNAIMKRAHDVLLNSTVGWGAEVTLKTDDESVKEQFNKWKEEPLSLSGENFFQVQRQIVSSMFIDGDGLAQVLVDQGKHKLYLFEARDLKDTLGENGITSNKFGLPETYHRNDSDVKAEDIIHCFIRNRPQQTRGITYYSTVIKTLHELDTILNLQMRKDAIAASITGAVTREGSIDHLDQMQHESDFAELDAGTMMRLNIGEKVEFFKPQGDGSFQSQLDYYLRTIAGALNLTHEMLSQDLSKVNFSSARIGQITYRQSIDVIRYQTLDSKFKEIIKKTFLKDLALKGVDTSKIGIEIVWPLHALLDAKQELETQKLAIRSGLQTYSGALKELGYDPKQFVEQIKQDNQMLDDARVILECDPRYTGNGQLAIAENLQALEIQQTNNNKEGSNEY